MADNRKNIKLDQDLFAQLKEDKGRNKSWPTYFREECLGQNVEGMDTDRLYARLEELETNLKNEIEALQGGRV